MNTSSNGKHAAPEDDPVDLIGMCYEHLSDTHIQLWGRAYNVSDPKSRQKAAEWLAEEISAVFA